MTYKSKLYFECVASGHKDDRGRDRRYKDQLDLLDLNNNQTIVENMYLNASAYDHNTNNQ